MMTLGGCKKNNASCTNFHISNHVAATELSKVASEFTIILHEHLSVKLTIAI